MSAPAASGTASSEGVPRSSALAFLAHTQPQSAAGAVHQAPGASSMSIAPEALVPAGVQALLDACSAIYPNQPNPLQVTTRLKYWLGGQDPLDYISMYWNPGNKELAVPSHWHYISFGLSDLHGDGRVHPRPAPRSPSASASPQGAAASPSEQTASPSGKGIELTFRLAASSPENAPLWPAAMMQALARYIHATGNTIVAGDHIRGVSLGNLELRHLLAARDPQLANLSTSHGTVAFTQLVACTGRELVAAQRGDPHKVLAAMATDTLNGCTPYLVSMCRRRSAVPAPCRAPCRVGVTSRRRVPAALAAVTAPVILLTQESSAGAGPAVCASETAHNMVPLTHTRESLSHSIEDGMRMVTESFEMSGVQRALEHIELDAHSDSASEVTGVRYLRGAHLVFSREAAAMLPLAIDGRVLCGSHFTFSWSCRVTLVGRDVTHALCRDAPRHLAVTQHWLQIYIPDKLAEDMSEKFAKFSRLADSESASETEDAPANNGSERDGNTSVNSAPKAGESDKDGGRSKRDERIALPCTFSWPEYNLVFSVVDDLYPKDFNML